MRVLVACEFSGVVRDAFRRRGHVAYSCDLLPGEGDTPEYHFQRDIAAVLADGAGFWDLLIAHPPCTYLCRAGWRWVNAPDSTELPLKGRPRYDAAMAAREFFLALLDAKIPRVAVENPRPIKHVQLPRAAQIIQPWQFGHRDRKETHLWLRNLPPLTPTNIVEPPTRGSIHLMSPSPDRAKRRSITYQGIADAMADQWGRL